MSRSGCKLATGLQGTDPLEENIDAHEKDQAAGPLLHDSPPFGSPGLQEVFDHPGKGAGQNDQGALAQGIGKEQAAAAGHFASGQGEDHGQHRAGTGGEYQTEQPP